MKRFPSLALAAVLLLGGGCRRPPQPIPSPPATPVPLPEVAATPTPTPTPVVVATPAPPPANRAPAGVYFLLDRITVTTGSSVIGYEPGQMVREITPGLYHIEGNEVEINPLALTNDLDVISRLLAEKRSQKYELQLRRLEAIRRQQELQHQSQSAPQTSQPTQQPSYQSEPIPPALPVARAEPVAPPQATAVQPPTPAEPRSLGVTNSGTLDQEQTATRTYETSGGAKYTVRVRGDSVEK